MKAYRIITGALAASLLLASNSVFAQTDDFGGDFGDTSSSSGSSSSSSSPLSIGGEGDIDIRAYPTKNNGDNDSFSDWDVAATPKGKLDVKYDGSKSDVELKLNFNKDVIETYHTDIIDELTMRAYLGNFVLEGGKMKLVWGKGDKLHVLDNFNANDYTDFLIPDYIDRRIAEPMVHVVYNAPNNIGPMSSVRLEGVYTPFMTADRFRTSGRWTPATATTLTNSVTNAATTDIQAIVTNQETARTTLAVAKAMATEYTNLAAATTDATAKATYTAYADTYAAAATAAQTALPTYDTQYITALSKSSSLASDLYPDLYQLKYGQAGARLTATIGTFDWGLSYYYGRNKQPTANGAKMSTYVAKYLAGTATDDDKFLDYDKLQVFGIEGATSVAGFNFRGEFAYNLTDDTAGDDPWVHNNSIAWVFGFDKDLPVNNINVNVQTVGKYILNNDKIDGIYKTADADYDSNGKYTNDKIVVNISDSYNHEKVKPEVSVIYGIERTDLMIMPKLTCNVADGLDIIGSGLYIHTFGDAADSEFNGFLNNSFIQLGMRYKF